MNLTRKNVDDTVKLYKEIARSKLPDGMQLNGFVNPSNSLSINLTKTKDFKLVITMPHEEHGECQNDDYWAELSIIKNDSAYYSDNVGYDQFFGHLSSKEILNEILRIGDIAKLNTFI